MRKWKQHALILMGEDESEGPEGSQTAGLYSPVSQPFTHHGTHSE